MRATAFTPPRPGRRLLRFLVPVLFVLVCFHYLNEYHGPSLATDFLPTTRPNMKRPSWSSSSSSSIFHAPSDSALGDTHPIDILIKSADEQFDALLTEESHTLQDAAAQYRARRGRHPPPGFGAWYKFAKERNAIVVEEFWDQVYHDLEPFWALDPAQLRKEARDWEMTISVRDHIASTGSDWFWTQIWLDMIGSIEELLPDMDIALNAMDEPRLVVPWEDVNKYMTKAKKTRIMPDVKRVVTEFQKLAPPGEAAGRRRVPSKKKWENTRPYWKIALRGCPPNSPARRASVMTNFNDAPVIQDDFAQPHTFHGYVSNYTMSTEVCHQPDLQGLNGIFVEPLSVSATKVMFPMFGGSKLAVNNEILLPAPMYWSSEERFTGEGGEDVFWDRKRDQVVWRGVATGGRNRESNWKAFHRHRFVAMNNGTKLTRAEDLVEPPVNFRLPSRVYGLKAQETGQLGTWVESWANVSFVDLMCHSKEVSTGGDMINGQASDNNPGGICNYTSPYFVVTPGIKMTEQFAYKYLPDIDGNSFSGRYLGFLRSTSLPIKATVFREWHDSRLMAWKHFVPMDNRYSDWFGIMEYFLGYKDADPPVPGHDAVAERIALAGQDWANKVLRREDMQVYVLRLLLEYARVSDERRETMGWVEDLLDTSGGGIRARDTEPKVTRAD